MADHLNKERRSWNMSRIRSKNTKPELIVRSHLHRMGYRFTVNGPLNKTLPGKPDIVLPKYKTVIFVHGCFWHRHKGCKDATTPTTNSVYWKQKFYANLLRDRAAKSLLHRKEWHVLTIWECHTKQIDRLAERIDMRFSTEPTRSQKNYRSPAQRA